MVAMFLILRLLLQLPLLFSSSIGVMYVLGFQGGLNIFDGSYWAVLLVVTLMALLYDLGELIRYSSVEK